MSNALVLILFVLVHLLGGAHAFVDDEHHHHASACADHDQGAHVEPCHGEHGTHECDLCSIAGQSFASAFAAVQFLPIESVAVAAAPVARIGERPFHHSSDPRGPPAIA